MRKTVAGTVVALLLIGVLTLAFNVQPIEADSDSETIHVDDDNVLGPWNGTEAYPYQNITSGLENASAGNTIFVHNGTYNEDIVVNKTVWLKGENRNTTTIKGTGTRDVINVTAPNVRICSFTINYSGQEEISCIFTERQNLTVDRCRIVTGYHGIYARHSLSSGLNVTNNIMVGGRYDCVHVMLNSQISITYNEMVGRGENGTSHSIDIDGSTAVTVAYNNISHNYDGVFLCNSIGEPYDVMLSNNYIANNTNGIDISIISDGGGSSATIVDNTITYNEYAVYQTLYKVSCDPHSFYHNNFIDNTYNNITFSGKAMVHHWDDSYPSCGNYWSNYVGNDTYSGRYQNQTGSDGIGDTPYVIDADNRDNYPLMQPYTAPVRNLNNGQSYRTIQDAINKANEGDTLFVKSGTYYENVVINKTLSLTGENKSNTIIDGRAIGDTVTITASGGCITDFTIQNGTCGIHSQESSGHTIFSNTVSGNQVGVYMQNSHDNIVSENNITSNSVGIESNRSYNNSIFHNNCIDNTQQVNITTSGYANVWDDGYPSGGNYWSDSEGVDLYHGPYQNETGSDGIGDVPHVVGENNQDNYTLMTPWTIGPHVNLTVKTFGIGEIDNVKVWIDNEQPIYVSPVTHKRSDIGQHTVKVESGFLRQDPEDPTKYYRYTFDHWEDGSNQNPRTIALAADKFLAAYYKVKVIYIEKRPSE